MSHEQGPCHATRGRIFRGFGPRERGPSDRAHPRSLIRAHRTNVECRVRNRRYFARVRRCRSRGGTTFENPSGRRGERSRLGVHRGASRAILRSAPSSTACWIVLAPLVRFVRAPRGALPTAALLVLPPNPGPRAALPCRCAVRPPRAVGAAGRPGSGSSSGLRVGASPGFAAPMRGEDRGGTGRESRERRRWRDKTREARGSGRIARASRGRCGAQLSLRRSGKNTTSRIEPWLVSIITRRSIPIPKPAAGGIPCSRART